jgi:hypothetical protein
MKNGKSVAVPKAKVGSMLKFKSRGKRPEQRKNLPVPKARNSPNERKKERESKKNFEKIWAKAQQDFKEGSDGYKQQGEGISWNRPAVKLDKRSARGLTSQPMEAEQTHTVHEMRKLRKLHQSRKRGSI